MFDITQRNYVSSLCFGFNPDISVYYDFTDLVLRNEKLFANAINMTFQIKIMERYLASLRSNRNERLSQEKIISIMAEIEGVTEGSGVIAKRGMRQLLIGEVRGLRDEINRLRNNYNVIQPQIITLS
jgi:hypothetical protein